MFQQLDTLRRSVCDSQLHHRLRIVTPAVQLFGEIERDGRAAAYHETLYLRGIRNGHDPRDDRYLDSNFPGAVDKFKIPLVIEEKLRDYEIQPFIDLFLEIHEV